MNQCKNCDTPLEGLYCQNCGQKDVNLKRPFVMLIGEALEEFFDLDGRAFRTLRALLFQPGVLTSEYLAGRRRLYTPPIRLYLIISVLFFVLIAWVAGRGLLLDPGQSPTTDAAIQAQFMSNTLPRLMFVLLPVFALLLKLVFWRRHYFDHVIYSLHLHSAAYIVLAVMLPLEQIASDNLLALIAQLVATVALLGYMGISIRRVYQASWLAAAAKTTVILMGYLMVVSITIETTSNFKLLAD